MSMAFKGIILLAWASPIHAGWVVKSVTMTSSGPEGERPSTFQGTAYIDRDRLVIVYKDMRPAGPYSFSYQATTDFKNRCSSAYIRVYNPSGAVGKDASMMKSFVHSDGIHWGTSASGEYLGITYTFKPSNSVDRGGYTEFVGARAVSFRNNDGRWTTLKPSDCQRNIDNKGFPINGPTPYLWTSEEIDMEVSMPINITPSIGGLHQVDQKIEFTGGNFPSYRISASVILMNAPVVLSAVKSLSISGNLGKSTAAELDMTLRGGRMVPRSHILSFTVSGADVSSVMGNSFVLGDSTVRLISLDRNKLANDPDLSGAPQSVILTKQSGVDETIRLRVEVDSTKAIRAGARTAQLNMTLRLM